MSIRCPGFDSSDRIDVIINGRAVKALGGDTVLAVLLLEKEHKLAGQRNRPRGPFCNMGVCFDCVVEVAVKQSDNWRTVRACQMPVEGGLQIRTMIEE